MNDKQVKHKKVIALVSQLKRQITENKALLAEAKHREIISEEEFTEKMNNLKKSLDKMNDLLKAGTDENT